MFSANNSLQPLLPHWIESFSLFAVVQLVWSSSPFLCIVTACVSSLVLASHVLLPVSVGTYWMPPLHFSSSASSDIAASFSLASPRS